MSSDVVPSTYPMSAAMLKKTETETENETEPDAVDGVGRLGGTAGSSRP